MIVYLNSRANDEFFKDFIKKHNDEIIKIVVPKYINLNHLPPISSDIKIEVTSGCVNYDILRIGIDNDPTTLVFMSFDNGSDITKDLYDDFMRLMNMKWSIDIYHGGEFHNDDIKNDLEFMMSYPRTFNNFNLFCIEDLHVRRILKQL